MIFETKFELSSIKRMLIVEGWIYFGLDENGDFGLDEDCDYGREYELYRVKIDGTQTEKISRDDETIYDYSIDEEWIYYETIIKEENEGGFQLWRMSHDGKDSQQVMQGFGMALDYTETEIFYVDVEDNVLYAVPYFSTEKRKIAEIEWIVWFVKVIDDWVYYRDADSFYKVKTDGSSLTKISVEGLPKSKRITVMDNWLAYFSDGYEYYEMIRIRDTYDTDALVDYLTEDIISHFNDETRFEAEIRKHE